MADKQDRLTDETRSQVAYQAKQQLITARSLLKALRVDGVQSRTLYNAQQSLQNTVEDVQDLERELHRTVMEND